MRQRLRLPTSLTQRFALAVAGLAAATLLLISFASWWMLSRQNESALQQLAVRERQFHAITVGLNLTALSSRMAEVAGSTILATGLVDSAGKEIYLQPFLAGIRQINGIPVQVLFTDFEGGEIASNNGAFKAEQRQWLKDRLLSGSTEPLVRIFAGAKPEEHELVALEPLIYSRTQTPEGGLLYKVLLKDLFSHDSLRLAWAGTGADSATVPAPPLFASLGFRIEGVPSLAASHRSLAPQYGLILLLTLVLFATVVLAGVRISALLTRDLRRLDQFSRQLGRDGLSPGRVALAGSSAEVATVAQSINQMLDRLSEQHEALLVEDEKLNRLADALRLADRRKDEFLAMLAHELRNPLAPIMTGAEMLKRLSSQDARIEQTGQIIVQQAAHMTRIIDDLLDVSRVTRGLVTLKKERLDFNDTVAMAVEQIQPLMDVRGHHLRLSLPGHPLPTLGDQARLIQVVSNLLNNAAKYTPEGGRIELQVLEQGGEIVLTLSDNGSGISPELLPEIFDLFTQGERTPDRRHGGLGLGLALVRSLLEQHGGRITATSPGLGLGSTFTLRLPCDHSLTPPPTAAPADDGPLQHSQRLHVHLVDDNQDAVSTLAMLLELDGHEVSVTYDAQTTLAFAASHPCDVFVLDIGLPDMDGTELAQRLRAMPAHARSVMLALTGYGQAADRARSMSAGFDHHLVKPVNYEQLSQLLAGVVERRAPADLATH